MSLWKRWRRRPHWPFCPLRRADGTGGSSPQSWFPYRRGRSLGRRGSENGVIVLDEEHSLGSRITLERNGITAPYAITCGIYGTLVHTRFFDSEAEARIEYDAMKLELERILQMIPFASDPDADAKEDAAYSAIADFVERFP